MAPSTTVSASGGNGHRSPQRLVEGGQDGIVEVAGRQRLAGDPGQHGAEVGQQVGVRGAGRQVEGEVAGTLGHPAVAARAARAGRVEHEGAPPAPGVDGADVGQRPPRLADRRRADAEAWRGRGRSGRRVPGASSPLVISRLMAAAMPRALRSSMCSHDVVRHPTSSRNVRSQTRHCARSSASVLSANPPCPCKRGDGDAQHHPSCPGPDHLDGRQGDDDQGPRGVRPRGRRPGRQGHLLPGAVLRPVLLPGAGRRVLRVRRVDPRPDHRALPGPGRRSWAW